MIFDRSWTSSVTVPAQNSIWQGNGGWPEAQAIDAQTLSGALMPSLQSVGANALEKQIR